ncbi:MAG TPA: carboxypeptidase-like regulatory domain-containing protein [Candidatus Binatia bacterium]|nr:carboxypeptidase-like regulatory domain-containing protein [Candidatus Binatia bacterium]
MRFVLSDGASSATLRAANLTAPTGIAIQSPVLTDPYSPTASAVVAVNPGPSYVLELRQLDIPAGGSVTVDLTVPALCSAASGAWALVANQVDNFSSGNFAIDPNSELTTGSCVLSFVDPPANAVAGQNVTSVGFAPSGAPIEVSASDGHGHPIAGAALHLSLVSLGGTAGAMSGTTTGSTGASGEATFGSISVSPAGYYELQAGATGFSSAVSGVFQITASATSCTGASCGGTVSSHTSTVAVSLSGAGSDILSLGFNGFTYSCSGYTAVSGTIGIDVWLANGSSLDLNPAVRQEVKITIPKQIVGLSPNNGAAFYEVCYASTQPFAGGSLASSADSIPGYVGSTYIGLLPQCPNHVTTSDAPCLYSRHKDNAGDVIIVFLAGPGDAWGTA